MILCKCTYHKAQGTLHKIIKNIVNNIFINNNKQKSCAQNDLLSKEDAGPQFLPLNCQAA